MRRIVLQFVLCIALAHFNSARCIGGQITPLDADAITSEVKSLLADGNTTEAIRLCKTFLEKQPENTTFTVCLSSIYYDTGQLDEAIRYAEKTLEIDQSNVDAYLWLAGSYYMKGEFDAAARIYRKAQQIAPLRPEVYHGLGSCYEERGDLDKAMEYLHKCIELDPLYDVYRLLGECYHKRGESKIPRRADVYHALAAYYKNQRNLEKAVEYYKRCIELDPKYVYAYNNLGVIYRRMGKTDEALDLYRQAMEINPNYYQPYVNVGNILKERGNLAEAVAQYQKALALEPGDANTHAVLAEIYLDTGRLDHSIREFQKALSLNSKDAFSTSHIGYAYYAKGETETGIEYMLKGQRLGYDYLPQLYGTLAAAYARLGKKSQALSALDKALAAEPKSGGEFFWIGYGYWALGMYDKAEQMFLDSVGSGAKTRHAHYYLGAICEQRGQLSLAEEHYRKNLEISPEDAATSIALKNVKARIAERQITSTLRQLFDIIHASLRSNASGW